MSYEAHLKTVTSAAIGLVPREHRHKAEQALGSVALGFSLAKLTNWGEMNGWQRIDALADTSTAIVAVAPNDRMRHFATCVTQVWGVARSSHAAIEAAAARDWLGVFVNGVIVWHQMWELAQRDRN